MCLVTFSVGFAGKCLHLHGSLRKAGSAKLGHTSLLFDFLAQPVFPEFKALTEQKYVIPWKLLHLDMHASESIDQIMGEVRECLLMVDYRPHIN